MTNARVRVVGVLCIAASLVSMTPGARSQVAAAPSVEADDSLQPRPALVRASDPAFAPPANDACAGAIAIPDGPYPVSSAVTTSVNQATGTGDPINSCSPSPVENGVWYRWAPSVGGTYTITTCAGTTSTNDGDGVLSVFTSSGGCGGAFTQVAGACNDDACHPLGPGTISGVTFFAGTTYYILVSHYPSASGGGGLITQAQVRILPVGAPSNDTCQGAEVIPPNGPYPYLTSVTDITGATADLNLPTGSCSQFGNGLGVWYTFTPTLTGDYLLSTCAFDHFATNTTSTTTGIVLFTSSSGCGGTFTEVPTSGDVDACDFGSCANLANQSFLSTRLTAGTTYYVWVFGSAGNVQLRVAKPPVNDICASATPVFLEVRSYATTAPAADDYHSPNTTQCYAGLGQVPTTAFGRDTVHTFTAPSTDTYSIRLYTSSLQALYVGDCYGGPPPVQVSCLAGSNRAAPEEISCLFLRQGQQVWIYVDEANRTGGAYYSVSISRCSREMEPNATPATASSLTCGMTATMDTGEVDFFTLGTVAAGSRAFARFDTDGAVATLPTMRITDTANTLQSSTTQSQNIAGTPIPGTNAYIRMDTATGGFEPYHLYWTVQPPIGSATVETEPNSSLAAAETTLTGYVSGQLPGPSPSTDTDFFRFNACKGDTLVLFLDKDPLRNATPILGNLWLLDAAGGTIAHLATNNPSSNTTPGPGLNANTPTSPGENFIWPAEYSGTYYAEVSMGNSTGSNGNGDYLLSISADCQRLGTLSSDVSVTIADAPDPVTPGNSINYAITMTNAGPNTARDMTLSTATPPNTTFMSVAAPAEWTCLKPAVGGTGAITCTGPYLEVGSRPITVVVRVNTGTSDGTIITGSAGLSTCRSDPNMVNNSASTTTTVTTGASLPAAGAECYASSLSVRVHLLPAFHPGGCTETLALDGPVKIWRSNPVDSGDGRDEVQTVMGCYLLSGTSGAGACALGAVLARPSVSGTSLGLVKSSAASASYPADAQFDLTLILDSSAGTLHANDTAREATTLSSVPVPPSSTFAGNGLTHALYDAAGTVVGDFEILQHELQSVVSCPCACSPTVSVSGDKQTLSLGIATASSGVEFDLVRGVTSASSPDWTTSFQTAVCAQSNGGRMKLDAFTPAAGVLGWYLSRDGAFGANGTYNACQAPTQVGDRDAALGSICP